MVQYERVDVLVNNAGFVEGITTDMPLEEAERLWDEVVDANLKGSFLMVVAIAPYLASPEASFITGEVLNVNGGWLFGH